MRIEGTHGRDLTVGAGQTRVMGIVNVTPDSFSDGGSFFDAGRAVKHGLQLAAEGADLLDVGGESTRPGYEPVPPEVQVERIVPVIEGLRAKTDRLISVDTTRAAVAAAALDAGADWINDTTAFGEDPELVHVVAARQCPVVLMHRFDPPRQSGALVRGPETVRQVIDTLQARVEFAAAHGVDPDRIILDPGLGFGTLFEDSLTLMANLRPLGRLPQPWLFGPSRKSFIGEMTGRPVAERLPGTAAAVAILAMQGVAIVRVHDVAAMVDVVKVADALRRASEANGQGRQQKAFNVETSEETG